MPVPPLQVSGVDFNRVTDVYTDGGLCEANASPTGGSFAFCFVDAGGARLAGFSGPIVPAAAGVRRITSTLTELIAVLLALEPLPDGWAGTVWTDSTTVNKAIKCGSLPACPEWLGVRLRAARNRLGAVSVEAVGGHPSRKELRIGRTDAGRVASPHNVWVDGECRIVSASLFDSRRLHR